MHHTPTGCRWLAATALIILGAARAADAPQSAPAAKALPKKILDLKPPDIKQLYTPEQIKRLLSTTEDPDIEGVEVEDAREKLINEAAPLWRRIPGWFFPRPDAADKYSKPDATSVHARPPAAPPPAMAGEERRYDR